MSRRKNATPLSPARIGAEALAIVDEEGLAALSMRRLADRLGVEPGGIYYHLSSKDALLDAMYEAIVADFPAVGDHGDWRDHLVAVAQTWRQGLRAHPAALPLFATRQARSPAWLAAADRTARHLRQAGFSPEDALFTIRTLASFVIGHALHGAPASPAPAVDQAPWNAALAEVLVPDPDRWFDFGLDVFIRGLERRVGGAR